jgi:hypothetical protein
MPRRPLKTIDRTPVGGDPRVVAHPAFREIPACLFPIQTEQAQKQYDYIARALFEVGRLTLNAHSALSSYAMQFDVITRLAAEGRTVRAHSFTQLDKARAALRLDEIDGPIASSEDAPVNKFARSGFSTRCG